MQHISSSSLNNKNEKLYQPQLCTLNQSHKKPILMICLNKQCQNSRLCCLTCIDQFHRKHQIISLNKFQSMLSELDNKYFNSNQSNIDIVNIVKQHQMNINNQIDNALDRTINQYKDAKKLVNLIFKDIFLLLQCEKRQKSVVQEFYEKFDSFIVNQNLKKLGQNKNNSYETTESTLVTIKKSQPIIKQLIRDYQQGYTKLMETFEKNISSLKKALTQSSYVPFSRKFSKIHKAACLTVSEDQMTTKRSEGSGGYPINLFETPLTKENNEFQLKITQEPGNKGIWLGIAILNIVKNNNFLSCYGIGKGTYAIDQVGASHQSAYTWNHHDSNFNSQPKVGFQFHIGDIVKIRVDFDKSSVTFIKGNDSYTQPIRLDLGDIYAFAGPTNLGDCLMIV